MGLLDKMAEEAAAALPPSDVDSKDSGRISSRRRCASRCLSSRSRNGSGEAAAPTCEVRIHTRTPGAGGATSSTEGKADPRASNHIGGMSASRIVAGERVAGVVGWDCCFEEGAEAAAVIPLVDTGAAAAAVVAVRLESASATLAALSSLPLISA